MSCQHGGCQGEHRVPTVLEPCEGGAVGLTLQVEPPASVGPNDRTDGNGAAQVDQSAALLDVQLDECPDPAQRLLIRADVLGVVAGCRHRLGHRDTVRVAQTSSRVGVELACDQPGSGTGDTEPCTL